MTRVKLLVIFDEDIYERGTHFIFNNEKDCKNYFVSLGCNVELYENYIVIKNYNGFNKTSAQLVWGIDLT